DDFAYSIYTSGSTGVPKGTLTTHTNVIRVVKDTNYIDLRPEDRLLQLSNPAFDGSVFDIFGALLNGASLVLPPKEQTMEVEGLAYFIKRSGVDVFFVTTALFNTLVELALEDLSQVRKILFGGERVSVKHTRNALAQLGPGKLLHMYGPTESTVYATYYPVDAIDDRLGTIPIGGPLANTTVYVLDERMEPVPLGVEGELVVGGPGLAAGYLNRVELTARRFIGHPFIEGRRLYRTGDLVRMLPNGHFEFLERKDKQVKLRGFRVELGEIENVLLRHSAVAEAVVTARGKNSDERMLCAYLVPVGQTGV
ncbi:MAG: amino acid adenylation domain-containing protein, partial [bacterium]|nr:amino acid adenylation domain-containing protein [bacterium]